MHFRTRMDRGNAFSDSTPGKYFAEAFLTKTERKRLLAKFENPNHSMGRKISIAVVRLSFVRFLTPLGEKYIQMTSCFRAQNPSEEGSVTKRELERDWKVDVHCNYIPSGFFNVWYLPVTPSHCPTYFSQYHISGTLETSVSI